jgi:predicted amino acid dehydrogenase
MISSKMASRSLLSAEVILKSASGRSLTDGGVAITSENVEEFRPSQETVEEAMHQLEKLGFKVSQKGVTLTIVGEPIQFEKAFKVKLTTKKITAGVEVHTNKEASIPPSLSNTVEKIVFIPPPEFFTNY